VLPIDPSWIHAGLLHCAVSSSFRLFLNLLQVCLNHALKLFILFLGDADVRCRVEVISYSEAVFCALFTSNDHIVVFCLVVTLYW
jgi:hypothetical protein